MPKIKVSGGAVVHPTEQDDPAQCPQRVLFTLNSVPDPSDGGILEVPSSVVFYLSLRSQNGGLTNWGSSSAPSNNGGLDVPLVFESTQYTPQAGDVVILTNNQGSVPGGWSIDYEQNSVLTASQINAPGPTFRY